MTKKNISHLYFFSLIGFVLFSMFFSALEMTVNHLVPFQLSLGPYLSKLGFLEVSLFINPGIVIGPAFGFFLYFKI